MSNQFQPTKDDITEWFKTLQDQICSALETCDGKATFQEDLWQREGGGGGRTRIIQHGDAFEKGGVNFSAVHGTLPENITKALGVTSRDFFAAGVSIVIHPKNPWVPIIHMNTRYFEIEGETWWFGGGIDMTPHYIFPDDAKDFHSAMKAVCDDFEPDAYASYKKWADDYFFIPHRNETRGIGGIFFDRLNSESTAKSKQEIFDFVRATGSAFAPTYTPIVNRRRSMEFTESHTRWQRLRRGRYVEFNLVYDKGTKFGLQTSGRIESILMSLPEMASWEYDVSFPEGSEEHATLQLLRKGIDWA